MSKPFPSGNLRQRLRDRIESALASGALEPMETRAVRVDDAGVPFVVRIVDAIARKERDAEERPPDFDPFLPYDEALHVADVGERHVCLLNKFYVLDDHLLIVTRGPEEQTAPLTRSDFEAWRQCMAEFPAFGFYNGGPTAGASQRHKHMQVVALPLARWSDVPIEARLDDLPFRHDLTRFDGLPEADALFELYRGAGERLGMWDDDTAYNLLLTNRWMLVVPRSSERFDSISVNGLGYAGALLVRDEAQLRRLRQAGLMHALEQCVG